MNVTSEEASFFLVVQLQTVNLLHVLLPEWTGSSELQKEFLTHIIDLLTEYVLLAKPDVVLEMAHSENRQTQSGTYKSPHHRLHGFKHFALCISDVDGPVPKVPLTCCYNSTVADALVGLLRHMLSFSSWTQLITNQLLCNSGNNYAASLAFIGGITNKPRLGGDIVTQDGRHGNQLLRFEFHLRSLIIM